MPLRKAQIQVTVLNDLSCADWHKPHAPAARAGDAVIPK
jgi:hypothetical protein